MGGAQRGGEVHRGVATMGGAMWGAVGRGGAMGG